MKKRYDQCFSVDIPVQELIDNLKESFASSIAFALNLDKLDARDFQVSLNPGSIQFYRMIIEGNDEE